MRGLRLVQDLERQYDLYFKLHDGERLSILYGLREESVNITSLARGAFTGVRKGQLCFSLIVGYLL